VVTPNWCVKRILPPPRQYKTRDKTHTYQHTNIPT
jgi:hypothetical protein